MKITIDLTNTELILLMTALARHGTGPQTARSKAPESCARLARKILRACRAPSDLWDASRDLWRMFHGDERRLRR